MISVKSGKRTRHRYRAAHQQGHGKRESKHYGTCSGAGKHGNDCSAAAAPAWISVAGESESAAKPAIVNVNTVVVRSAIPSFRTTAFRRPIAIAVEATTPSSIAALVSD